MSAWRSKPAGPDRLLTAWKEERFILLLSPPIVDEISRVLRSPRLQRLIRLTTAELHGLIESLLPQEILSLLLGARAGLEGIDQALQALSDKELDALVERARSRGRDLPEPFVATVIGEALRFARASSRS